MKPRYQDIQELLARRNDLQTRLHLIPYDGTPEIKGKYLYVRSRKAGKLTSAYVGKYTKELHNLLARNAQEARTIKKELSIIEKQLTKAGYKQKEMDEQTNQNLDFVRANLKTIIYDQTVLEGIEASFDQVETVLENGIISGLKSYDILNILHLNQAWQFILDKDVLACQTDLGLLEQIAKRIHGERIRSIPVTVGKYMPPIPNKKEVKDAIQNIIEEKGEPADLAIKLCLFCMKAQIFADGNKRTAVIFANHYLIGQGKGLLVIPEKEIPEFKRLLAQYYAQNENAAITAFMKERCLKTF
jgi:prophage maintenance system killer protein